MDDTLKVVESNTRKSTVKVFYQGNTNLFWIGFVVGQVDDLAIILTTAHCLRNTKDLADDLFLVCFYGENGPSRNYEATVQFAKEESEILLLSVKLEPGLTYPKLLFAPEGEWNVSPGDPLLSVSHPLLRPWRLSVGWKCSEDSYFGDAAGGYDKNMVVFEHNLDLVTGSSGSALVNTNGHVVGLQSRDIIENYDLVSGVPFLQACDWAAQNHRDPIHVQLDWRHVVLVPIHTCHLKYVVHTKYLDEILPSNLVVHAQDQCLNGIIETYIRSRLLEPLN